MKIYFRSMFILFNFAVIVAILAACSGPGNQPTSEANPTEVSAPVADFPSIGECRLALLLPGSAADYQSIQSGVEEAAAQNDCQVDLYTAEYQAGKMAAQIQESDRNKVLGMIIKPIDHADVKTAIQQAGIPVALLGAQWADVQTNRVIPDFVDGARQAAGFICGALHEHGNIVQLTDVQIDGVDGAVSKAFSDTIKTTCPEAKLTSVPLKNADEETAKQAMLQVLSAEPDVSAVFAFTESAMNGALGANQEAGIMGVVTAEFGNELADLDPNRTIDATLRTPGSEAGKAAVQAVLSQAAGADVKSPTIVTMQVHVSDIAFQLPPDPTTKRITVGVLLPDGNTSFYRQVYSGLLSPSRALDNVTLKVRSANNDPKKMIQQLDWMVNDKVDAILVSPFEDNDLLIALDRAARSGMPLVTLGLNLGMENMVSQISFDEYAVGYAAGQYLCAAMGGQGSVADVYNSANLEKEKVRSQGLAEYLQENCPEVKVSEQALPVETACQDLRGYLSANAVDGIFAHSDELGLCAVDVSTGKFIISAGGGDEALQSIRDGKLSASLGQYPYEMGVISMETTIEYLYGKQVEPNKPFPVNLITKDTLK